MSKIMPIVALIALAPWASAIEVTTTPGQLSSQLDDTSVTELTVSGEMDARDFQFIANELSSLTSIDLSRARYLPSEKPRWPAATILPKSHSLRP